MTGPQWCTLRSVGRCLAPLYSPYRHTQIVLSLRFEALALMGFPYSNIPQKMRDNPPPTRTMAWNFGVPQCILTFRLTNFRLNLGIAGSYWVLVSVPCGLAYVPSGLAGR